MNPWTGDTSAYTQPRAAAGVQSRLHASCGSALPSSQTSPSPTTPSPHPSGAPLSHAAASVAVAARSPIAEPRPKRPCTRQFFPSTPPRVARSPCVPNPRRHRRPVPHVAKSPADLGPLSTATCAAEALSDHHTRVKRRDRRQAVLLGRRRPSRSARRRGRRGRRVRSPGRTSGRPARSLRARSLRARSLRADRGAGRAHLAAPHSPGYFTHIRGRAGSMRASAPTIFLRRRSAGRPRLILW